MPKPQTKLSAIYSYGRSGSTWLGAIINSHPEVAYRFEPFRRLKNINPDFRVFADHLARGRTENITQQDIVNLLLPAHPLADKPPYFRKSNALGVGKTIMWMTSRALNTPSIFGKVYAPSTPPFLVFKEVGFNVPLDALDPAEFCSIPIIYLLRHPCGTVLSQLNGQRARLMPTWQLDNIDRFLLDHAPDLLARFPEARDMSDVQKNALLWLCAVNNTLELAQEFSNIKLISYEALCKSTLDVAREVFDHLQIPWHSQTEQFIQECINLDEKESSHKRFYVNEYFNVYRNPRTSCDKWKWRMPEKDQEEVISIVSDSPVYNKFFASVH